MTKETCWRFVVLEFDSDNGHRMLRRFEIFKDQQFDSIERTFK